MDPIWLDVPLKRAFDMELLDPDPDLLKHPGIQLVYIQLIQYHRIPKPRLALFPQRIMALRGLARLAATVDLPDDPSVRRWIQEWVVDQGLKKAEYLAVLQQYYRDNDHEVRDPSSLLNQLRAPRAVVSLPLKPVHVGSAAWKTAKPGETAVGLHGGVRLEAIDPMHRAFEFQMQGDAVTGVARQQEIALQQWVQEVRTGACTEPFFVYLEDWPCCVTLSTNREMHFGIVDFPGIRYLDGGRGAVPAGVWQVAIHNGQAFTINSHGYGGIFDTNWISPRQSPKGTRDQHRGRTTMAYNWTRHGELLVGLHKEFEMHHSSFTGGGLVRCAGMIGARNGKIYWVDNDSGHYRPPSQNLWRFVKSLKDQGALSSDARIFNAAAPTGSIQKQLTGMNVDQYLANPSGRSFAIGGHRAPPSTGPRLGGHRRR